MGETKIYDARGTVIKSVTNLDPLFFSGGVLRGATSQNELKILKQPYRWHTWVYACAHNIAVKLSTIPHLLRSYNPTTKEEAVNYDHEILRLLNAPNPYMNKTTFWEAIVLALMLPSKNTPGGQAFIIPESGVRGQKVDLSRGQIPKELYPFSDNSVAPRYDKDTKQHNGWILHLPGNQKIEYEFNELIRVYLFNPYNMVQGQCPLAAAMNAVQLDGKADAYNSRAFDNDGTLGGVLSSDQPLTKDQREEMLKAWMESYGGPANARGIAVLGMGLKYEQFARSQADMEYMKQKEWSRDEIFAVYGLNELAFGRLKGIPFANVKEGRKLLWTDTYIPYQNTIWESMNYQWINYAEKGKWEGDSDWSTVEALREDIDGKVKTGEILVQKMFVPPAEAIRLMEIPIDLKKYPSLEYSYVPASMVPVKAGEEPVMPTPGETPPIIDDEEDKRLQFKMTKDERLAFSDEYIALILTVGEKSFREKMVRFFYRQKREMQDKVDDWLKMNRGEILSISKQDIDQGTQLVVDPKIFLFDLVKENEKIMELFEPEVEKQMKRETAKVSGELGGLVNWSVTPEAINDYIEMRAKYVKGINTSTFRAAGKKISDLVAQAFEENWTTERLAKELKKGIFEVAEVRVHNAKTIARTEIGSISSATRYGAFQAEGVKYQEWITARDERVRREPYDHAAEDGEVVEVGKRFPHTGLLYPREMGGAPANVINCSLDENAMVDVLGGRKKVSEIQIGDIVLTHNQRYRRVVRLRPENTFTGHDVTLWAIDRKVRITAGHPFKTLSGWNRADSLKRGDFVEILFSSSDIEEAKFIINSHSDVCKFFKINGVPASRFIDVWEKSDQFCTPFFDFEKRKHEHGSAPRSAAERLIAMDGHPIGSAFGSAMRVGIGCAEPENGFYPFQYLNIPIRKDHPRSSPNLSFVGASPDADTKTSVSIKEASNIGDVADCYHKFNITFYAPITNLLCGEVAFHPVWNFAVECDESYILDGFVSHNCRCVTVAAKEPK